MTESTSALVRIMVETGEPRAAEAIDNSGVDRICWRRSGEAFRRKHFDEFGETITWACVRGRAFMVP
jgi:hypothetical protein